MIGLGAGRLLRRGASSGSGASRRCRSARSCSCIVIVMAIDIPMFKGARSTGTIRWGTIAPRSQYVLILLAVTFTWLMGLMGFARSGIRQHWHIYGVMQDQSPDAVDAGARLRGQRDPRSRPSVFFLMVMFIFWLGGLGEKGHDGGGGAHGRPPGASAIAGGSPEA